MGGLEERGVVADVGAGRDPDAAHLGRQGVGDVVAVEVHRGDDVVLGRARQDLLQEGVGDDVLDEQPVARVPTAILPGHRDVGELVTDQLVPPFPERPLGVLHDVALVHERHRPAGVIEGVAERGTNEALATGHRDRLDADAAVGPQLPAVPGIEELEELLDALGALLELLAGVDVLGVLPEDHHVDELGLLHRRRHPRVPAHRAQAHVEVEDLAQGHVEAADAAADRRRQRALDPDEVGAEGLDRLVGEPLPGLIERLLPGEDLEPDDLPRSLVGLGHRRLEDVRSRPPDVGTDPIAFDEGDDGRVGYLEAFGGHRDAVGHWSSLAWDSACCVAPRG